MRTQRPVSINNSLAHGICNYSCRLCSVNKPQYRGPKAFQSLEVTEALIARVRQAAAEGMRVRYVANAGDGEPTLHPDFCERMALFGRMLKNWNAPTEVPEVSVVTNGARLTQPGILNAVADNGLSLIVSFPTPVPEAYGAIMVGQPSRGAQLLATVAPGLEAAMTQAARGALSKLYFHISPPERELVRRDFADTIAYLTGLARKTGLRHVDMIMFPATSNRSGTIRNRLNGTDMYRDLFQHYDGKDFNGVQVRMKLVLERFLRGYGELWDLLKAFSFPCLWNANLFIAPEGSSICCNDQSIRHPMGNILEHSLEELMAAKESHRPGNTCQACDQRPERMRGSAFANWYSLAARLRMRWPESPASSPAGSSASGLEETSAAV